MTTKAKTTLFSDTIIKTGGLMRCEIDTIEQYVYEHLTEHVPVEPLTLDCAHEPEGTQNIILKDGVWMWHPEI